MSFYGITFYGTIDVGYGYESNGARFNIDNSKGVAELVQKQNNGAKWLWTPNGLSQSNVGLKMKEEIAPGWSIIGDVNAGFDPYSLRLANDVRSLVDNNGVPLALQTTNSDGSRAGQFDNTRGYIGFNNPSYGTLTYGRQYTFSNDAISTYDPMGGSYAFSAIGWSSTYVGGTGVTETARYNQSLKYLIQYQNVRFGAEGQLGGYEQGNGAREAFQFDLGGDYNGFSIDGIYSYARDAVSLSTYASPLPAGVVPTDLKATLADINAGVVAAKYNYKQLTVYGGYEYAVLSNPSDPATSIGGTVGGFTVIPGAVSNTTYTVNKDLQVAWTGAKYAIRSDLDLSGAYYIVHQNNYTNYALIAPAKVAGTCAPNTTPAIAGASPQGSAAGTCAGNLQAASFLIDYRPVKRVDIYAGVMYSIVSGGIANGYIKSQNWAPTAGLRFSF